MWKTILTSIAILFSASTLAAQKPILVVPTGHSSGVQSVSCSADGKYFLTFGGDGLIKLWNDVGKEFKTLKLPLRRFTSASLSPDNDHILAISGYMHSDAWVLKTASGELDFSLKGHNSELICGSYSPKGQWIATGATDSSAILWDARDGRLIRRFEGHQKAIGSLVFSPDGNFLATLSYDKTAKIWETATGKLLRTIEVCEESGGEIQFSPNGKLISVLCRGHFFSQDRISLWSTATGEKIREIDGYSLRFSPDGKWVCVFRQSKAFVYASESLDEPPYRTFQATYPPIGGPLPTNILYGTFLPDSKGLLLNAMHIPEVYALETGQFRLALKGYSIPIECVSFSPDAKKCLAGSETDLLEMEFTEGARVRRFIGDKGKVTNARYAPDGQKIVSVTAWCSGTIRDATTGKEMVSLTATPCTEPAPRYSKILEIAPDGQSFMRGYDMGNQTGPPILSTSQFSDGTMVDSLFFPFEGVGEPDEIALSQDGKQMGVLSRSMLLVWDVDTRQWDKIFDEAEIDLGPLDFYAKNKIAIAQQEDIEFWDTQERKRIGSASMAAFYLKKDEVTGSDITNSTLLDAAINDLVCSHDGKWLAAAYGNTIGLLRCSEVKPPEIVHLFEGHDDAVLKIDFSADNRWLISCSIDNTIRIWDLEKRKEAARIIYLNQNDWAITTPSGLFDASPGAMEMMYFLSGEEVIELDQLKKRYYEPGLISKVLGLASGELRNVEQFQDLPLYPKIEAEIVQNQLNITLSERNGGIGKLSLFVNGTERGAEDINPERKQRLSLDLKTYAKYFSSDTLNTIALRAYNAQGWLKSAAYELPYDYTGAKGSGQAGNTRTSSSVRPRLFALVIGTADYSGDKLDLKYADQDAASMAAALAAAGKELYGDEVHIRLFTTGSNLTAGASSGIQNEMSSKANIQAAFEGYAKPEQVQASDVMVVYFSGHGITYGEAEKAQFYYLTKDIASEDLSDPEVRRNYTISSDTLTEWIKNIAALKQVLILDACNSGKIVESLAAVGQKDLNPSQVRAFDEMKDRTGMFILTGSAADMVSYEASQYGQGLLTYSLLEGMSGLALADDKRVDVMTLFQHSRKRVPELAKSIKGIQNPVLAFPVDGGSFYIGRVNENVKIPLSQLKPIFIRNVFQDEEAFDDVLGLGDALEEYFRQQNAKGAQSKLIYVDVKDYENAYSMKGRYTIRENEVEVSLRLFKGKTVVGGEFNVNGKKDDVPGLVKQILGVVLPIAK